MTELAVARLYRFQAQHHVPYLLAPWNEPHFHDYTVEVEATAELNDGLRETDGLMVIDTDMLDAAWERLKPTGDDLNADYAHTTVEWLAAMWLEEFRRTVGWAVHRVTVWEDNTRWGRAKA